MRMLEKAASAQHISPKDGSTLRALCALEAALVHQGYGDVRASEAKLRVAGHALGLSFEVTGGCQALDAWHSKA